MSGPGTAEAYNARIAVALGPYGRLKSGAKVLAGLAEATDRAARNWLAAACGPQAHVLIRLMARDPAVADAVQTLVEEQRRLDAMLAARLARPRPE